MKSLACSLLFVFLAGSTFVQAGETVLYAFHGGRDGFWPNGPLVADSAGNFYGTTYYGGDESCNIPYGCGTVFELSPNGQGGWTELILYRFPGGAKGQQPGAGLVRDSQGNLFGTTAGSGADNCVPNCGSAFELTPSGGGWTFTLLHAFRGGKDGGIVAGGLTADATGALYGTTSLFGPAGHGTVFQLSNSGNGWVLKTLHAFALDQYGSNPQGSLIVNPAGKAIDGAAKYGGVDGYGVVYGLSANAKGQWTEKVLFQFPGKNRGGNPRYGLTSDSLGNLYGIATKITNGMDVIYQVSKSNDNWTERTIFNFRYPISGQPDGAGGNVLLDQAGNAFGFGDGGSARDGTIYELTESANKWAETLLYDFQGDPDGVYPVGPPIMDTNGNLYGVTTNGGGSSCVSQGCGTIFEFTP